MLIWILIFTLLGSVLSLGGSIFLLFRRKLNQAILDHLINFAAGVLIAVAFLDLLPEATETKRDGSVFAAVLVGFVIFFFAERLLQILHRHHGHGQPPTTTLVLVGDGLHNFIDGVAITASFLTSIPLGIATSLAVAAHEIPQEIADVGILLANGLSRTRALVYNFASALTAFAGALLAFFYSSFVESYLHIFLALTAGFFIYISASDLIPQIHEKYKENKKINHLVSFIIGIILVLAMGSVINRLT